MDNSNTDTDQLDLSWTEEHIRTTKGQTMYNKEPMSKINIQFIYINTNNEISRIIKEDHDLTLISMSDNSHNATHNASSMLSEQIIFQLTKSKGRLTGTSLSNGLSARYHLDDILLYCVSLDPANIFDYVASPANKNVSNNDPFMKILSPICGNIIVPPSLFIFHPLNTIYFIFREMVLVQDILPSHNPVIKSVLKSANPGLGQGLGQGLSKKLTKRVRISPDLPSYKNLGQGRNKTAKIRI